VVNVTNFTNFMASKTKVTFSAANLSAIYNGWSASGVSPSIAISFGTAEYTAAGAAGKAVLVAAPNNWTITDGGQEPTAFTSTWLVTAGETITLPYEVTGTYSGTIDWGDSSTSTNSYANRTHTYVGAGTYTISITGVTTGFRFNNTGSKLNIRTITNWGTLKLGNSGSYFYGCSNLTLTTVAGTLDLTGTNDFINMFNSCSSLTTVNGINSWNTGAVTNMLGMFQNCSNFNQALSFNTASVQNMQSMFNNDVNFNSSLTFNTGLVNNMSFLFFGCSQLNTAPTFTSTAAVTNMQSMFRACINFNKPLTLNTSSVNFMTNMFNGATAFNQNIGTWNTVAVTSMQGMFNGATAFNQNIGSWNVANVTNFTDFMVTKTPATFSTTNLDAIYNGWVTVQSSRTITFGTAKYSAAGVAGRNYLTTTKLWTITDGGL
jgi:surface protein